MAARTGVTIVNRDGERFRQTRIGILYYHEYWGDYYRHVYNCMLIMKNRIAPAYFVEYVYMFHGLVDPLCGTSWDKLGQVELGQAPSWV